MSICQQRTVLPALAADKQDLWYDCIRWQFLSSSNLRNLVIKLQTMPMFQMLCEDQKSANKNYQTSKKLRRRLSQIAVVVTRTLFWAVMCHQTDGPFFSQFIIYDSANAQLFSIKLFLRWSLKYSILI
jgi:hypothetical protein